MKLALIALGLALAGCVGADTEESRVQESQIPQDLGQYRTASVDVTTQEPEQYDGVEPLRTSLIAGLTRRVCFDSFINGAEPQRAELLISAVLIGASGVSSTERVLLGGLAGKPRVTVDVRLVDLRSGTLVGRFKVEGTTSGGSPTGHTTPEAYENAGTGIAEYIHRHK